jgi:catechol 2,3-dioxygenase-like lactoylglutathione lyase family enzyme
MEQQGDGRVTGFFHAGVTVRDMDEALRFYRDALGLEVASLGETGGDHARRIWNMEPGRVRVAFLRVPGSDALVELFEFDEVERHSASARPCDYGAGHFCLYCDDAEAVHRRLVAHGFRARSADVVTVAAGPHAGAKVFYAIDPDGYHVELYQRAPRA